jgi:hypothetical protein
LGRFPEIHETGSQLERAFILDERTYCDISLTYSHTIPFFFGSAVEVRNTSVSPKYLREYQPSFFAPWKIRIELTLKQVYQTELLEKRQRNSSSLYSHFPYMPAGYNFLFHPSAPGFQRRFILQHTHKRFPKGSSKGMLHQYNLAATSTRICHVRICNRSIRSNQPNRSEDRGKHLENLNRNGRGRRS